MARLWLLDRLRPRHLKKTIASDLKLIFQAENQETALRLANDLIQTYGQKAKAAMDCLERGLDDGLAVLALPVRYRRRLRTTNLAERMNEEIRRRERVIRIFPNEQAAERLIVSDPPHVRSPQIKPLRDF